MKMIKNLLIVAFVLALAACGNSGGNTYLGKWVRTGFPNETLVITRNGDGFLVQSIQPNPFEKGQPSTTNLPAVLKNGALEFQTGMGAADIVYVEASKTLSVPGGMGSIEYKRLN